VQSWTPPGRIEAVQAELLQYAQPQGMSGHPQASTYRHDQALARQSQMQSFADISTLWITTKAQQVMTAIQSLLPRLSSDSTLVLLQNGAGLLEQMIRDLFPDQEKRPSFVLCVNTHGAYVKDWGKKASSKGIVTEWAGVGDIAFGVLPNIHMQRHVEQHHPDSPLLNPFSSIPPPLSHFNFPSSSSSSLQTTISSLLACTELNPRFLSLSALQVLQKQKVAVNAVINPLTSIYDIKNGLLLSHNQHIQPTMFGICQEASSVFAAQLRRELHEYSQKVGQEQLSVEQKEILETGTLQESHPLHAVSLYTKTIQVARSTGQNISSTLQDIRAGKPQTEM
jgi:2-dehydropantoate 2-reductase